MSQNRVFGNIPGMKPMTMAPAFGESVYELIIETNSRGMMRTRITKFPLGNPPTQIQVMGMLLDCLNGQYQSMLQSASMLVNPNGKGLNAEAEKSNDSDGGTSGGTNPGS